MHFHLADVQGDSAKSSDVEIGLDGELGEEDSF